MVRVTKVRTGRNDSVPFSRNGKLVMVGTKRRGPTNRQLNRKIKKLQRDQELKFVETAAVFRPDNNMVTPAATALLNAVAAGDTIHTRDGNQVRATSLLLRFSMRGPNTADPVPPIVRVIVFWDRQANQGPPEYFGLDNASALLTNQSVGDPIFANTNMNTWSRYKVLYDKTFTVPFYDASGVNSFSNVKYVKKKIRLSRVIQYDDIVANASAFTSNSLNLLIVSNKSVAGDTPVVGLSYRFYFKDT